MRHRVQENIPIIALAHLQHISKYYIWCKVPFNVGLFERIYFSAEKMFDIQGLVDGFEIYVPSINYVLILWKMLKLTVLDEA